MLEIHIVATRTRTKRIQLIHAKILRFIVTFRLNTPKVIDYLQSGEEYIRLIQSTIELLFVQIHIVLKQCNKSLS